MARNKAYKGVCGGRIPPHVDMLFFQGPKPYAVSRAQKSLIRHCPDSDTRRKKVQWSDLDEKRELHTNEERNYNNPRSMYDRDFLRRSTYKNPGCDWNRNQFANDYDRFYGEKR